jgi:hypothetical protein
MSAGGSVAMVVDGAEDVLVVVAAVVSGLVAGVVGPSSVTPWPVQPATRRRVRR